MTEEIKQPETTETPSQQPAATAEPQNEAPQSRSGGFQRRSGGGGRGGRGGRGMRRGRDDRPKSEFEQKVLDIARVSRVTKGGKRFSFRTTIAIGDGKGRVGVGMAKGKDVAQSVQKAFNQAKKRLITVPIHNGSIPYPVTAKFSSAVVILKPGRGGVKAGGPVRAVAKLSGITGLTGKLTHRTNNKINIAMATIEALKKIDASKVKFK